METKILDEFINRELIITGELYPKGSKHYEFVNEAAAELAALKFRLAELENPAGSVAKFVKDNPTIPDSGGVQFCPTCGTTIGFNDSGNEYPTEEWTDKMTEEITNHAT